MQLRYEQLGQHLSKNLLPLYVISGDVPLLMQEACDVIRQAAKHQGYDERVSIQVEPGFSWPAFLNSTKTLSLFSSKQLLELHIPGNSPGDVGIKTLKAYVEKLPADKILLITLSKLESSTQRTVWYQALDKAGITVQLWPIENAQLPRWVAARLASRGLQADPAGLQMLADRSEGNLLAAAQEIEKLLLIYGSGKLSVDNIAESVSHSARFDIFALVDAALEGNGKRVVAIVNGLQEEGIEPVLVLWALAREIRGLATQAHAICQGAMVEKVLQDYRVWEKRKALFKLAHRRHSVDSFRQLLQRAGQLDLIVKGQAAGNSWDELRKLGLALAGVRI